MGLGYPTQVSVKLAVFTMRMKDLVIIKQPFPVIPMILLLKNLSNRRT